jgi:hypothetical protein
MTGGRLEIVVSTVQNTVYVRGAESHLKILGVGVVAWRSKKSSFTRSISLSKQSLQSRIYPIDIDNPTI